MAVVVMVAYGGGGGVARGELSATTDSSPHTSRAALQRMRNRQWQLDSNTLLNDHAEAMTARQEEKNNRQRRSE
jgi:hypothetical protein